MKRYGPMDDPSVSLRFYGISFKQTVVLQNQCFLLVVVFFCKCMVFMSIMIFDRWLKKISQSTCKELPVRLPPHSLSP